MLRPDFSAFSFQRRVALLLLVLALCTTGCRSTRFPEDPAAHPLWEELQEAPDEYYFLVRTGVRSRVLGLMPEQKMRGQLMQVKQQWANIDRWQTTPRLLEYLRTHGLTPVVERVAATLAANASNAPPDGIEERLEAGAIKIGLLEAYHEARRAP